MEVSRFNLLFHLFILISIFSICKSDDPDCVYTVHIKTGSQDWAGTDSIINLTLSDAFGRSISIRNLESWGGLMGKDHDYFERGNLDIFSGRGKCLSGPVCSVCLTSDGSGSHPGWYVDYVKVTTTGLNKKCTQEKFTVELWLDSNTKPRPFSAIRNYCRPRIGNSNSFMVPVMV